MKEKKLSPGAINCGKCGEEYKYFEEVNTHKCNWWKPMLFENITGVTMLYSWIIIIFQLRINSWFVVGIITIPFVDKLVRYLFRK